MSLFWRAAPALFALVAATGPAHATDGSVTAQEAVAMVQRGVAYVRLKGPGEGYAAINDKHSPFHDRDLYLVVYGLDGVVRAHGAQAQLIGRNLRDVHDIDGKQFVRERIELARVKSRFWQDYKFVNPVSRQIEPKRAYCERLDDVVICGGIYLK